MFQNLAKFWGGGGQFDPPLTQLGGGGQIDPPKIYV